MEHTKTPWNIENESFNEPEYKAIVGDGEVVARDIHQIDAAFIVKAVNNHYQLLDALKDIVQTASQDTLEAGKKAIKQAESVGG